MRNAAPDLSVSAASQVPAVVLSLHSDLGGRPFLAVLKIPLSRGAADREAGLVDLVTATRTDHPELAVEGRCCIAPGPVGDPLIELAGIEGASHVRVLLARRSKFHFRSPLQHAES